MKSRLSVTKDRSRSGDDSQRKSLSVSNHTSVSGVGRSSISRSCRFAFSEFEVW